MYPYRHFGAPVMGPSQGYSAGQDFVQGPEYLDSYPSEEYYASGYLPQPAELSYNEFFDACCNAGPPGEPADATPTTHGAVIDPALLTQDSVLEVLGEKDWMNANLESPWESSPEVQGAQAESGHVRVEATVDVTSVTATITYTDDVVPTAKEEASTTPSLAAAPADSPSTSDSVKSESVPPENEIVVDSSKLTMDDIKLMASNGVGSYTLFKDAEEARRSLARTGLAEKDPTLPTTEDEKRVIVLLLVAAFNRTSKAKNDSAKTIARFTNETFKADRVELMCWKLLEGMIILHTEGPLVTENNKKNETGNKKIEIGRFIDRVKLLLHDFETSKLICKHSMDPDYIETISADPLAALKRVMSNQRVNYNKSRIIKAGTKVLAESKAAEGQQAPDQAQASHDDDGSTPNPQLGTPAATTTAGKKRTRKSDAKGAGSNKKARRA